MYDGWNLIQEENDNERRSVNGIVRLGPRSVRFLAGARAGLWGLLRNADTGSVLYLYDATCLRTTHRQNGNVGQLVNASTGSLAAH